MATESNLIKIEKSELEAVAKQIALMKEKMKARLDNKAEEEKRLQNNLRNMIRMSWNNQGHKVTTEDADLRKLIQAQVLDEANDDIHQTLQSQVKKIQEVQNKSHTKFKKTLTENQDKLEKAYSNSLTDAIISEGMPTIYDTVSEIVTNKYNKAIEDILIPEMNNIFSSHCQRIDAALTMASQSVSKGLRSGQSTASPRIAQRLQSINRKLENLSSDNDQFKQSLQSVLQEVSQRRGLCQLSPQEEIQHLINQQDFHTALNKALNCNNLDLVIATCHKIPVDLMFQRKPEQLTILSLIAQLTVGLKNVEDAPLKISFLLESVKAMEPNQPCIAQHGSTILKKLKEALASTPRTIDNVSTLDWAVDMRLRELNNPSS